MFSIKAIRGGLLTAAFIALAGVQAASAAEPIQYVKVCSLYGAGFYYIPGTDICMRVGGYVRSQVEVNSAFNGAVYGSSFLTDLGKLNRTGAGPNYTVIAVASFDTREQTAFGTLRTYLRIGLGNSSLGSTMAGAPFQTSYIDRGFIQFAGFTFGLARSMFDIFTNARQYSYADIRSDGDTGTYGATVAAYTAQFAHGLSATISAEDPGHHTPNGVADGSATAFAINGVTSVNSGGTTVPDIIGNIRIDQSWGYAGLSGALHQLRAAYYGTPDNELSGRPTDTWGWAAAVGGQLNLPGGDSIGINAVYSLGASGYATRGGNWQLYKGVSSVGIGWLVDGLFDNLSNNKTNIERTRAWSINVGGEHRWTDQLATSLYGGYTDVSYGDAAKNLINAHLPGPSGSIQCQVPVGGAVWPPLTPPVGASGVACDPSFSFWQAGSRTEWTTVDRTFHAGFDVFHTHLNTAYKGATTVYNPNGSKPAVTGIADQGIWSAIVRVQRDITP